MCTKNRILISLSVGIMLLLGSCQSKPETTSPSVKKITEAVYASGAIEPFNNYEVFSPINGILKEKMVDIGQDVKADQPLFSIENQAPELKQQNASQVLFAAERNASAHSPILNELRLNIETARQRMLSDSLTYSRELDLYQNKATAKVDLERAELTYKTSRNAYKMLKNSLRQKQTDLQEEIRNARIQYQLTTQDNSNTFIQSKIAGKVFQIYKKRGEAITSQEPLALIGADNQYMLNLLVDERDIARIKIGQQVLYKTETMPDSVFEAKIVKIYPYLNNENRSFRVDALLEAGSVPVYAGSSVEANIIIQEKDQALVIPRTYLLEGDSVQIEQNGKPVKIKIKKGIETLDMVEVKQGLDKNAKLLKGNE